MSVPARGTTDPAGLDATEVEALTRRALRLSQFTVAYNVAEGVVAVAAGLLAGLVSLTFFALAGYVTVEGIRSLAAGDPPEHSTAGIVLLVLSVVIMPVLARAKRRVAVALGGDRLILADAAQTKICVLLSISTLVALGLYAVTGAAWLDPVAGFVIAVFAVREGREAWEGELVEDDDDDD